MLCGNSTEHVIAEDHRRGEAHEQGLFSRQLPQLKLTPKQLLIQHWAKMSLVVQTTLHIHTPGCGDQDRAPGRTRTRELPWAQHLEQELRHRS